MKNVNHIPLRISLLLGFLTLCLTAFSQYTITWKANGQDFDKTTVVDGQKLVLPLLAPSPAPSCSSKVFVGWCGESYSSSTDAPVCAKNGDAVNRDTTYYAVFADTTITRDPAYKITTTITAGKTYVFGAVAAAASPTLANNTKIGAVAFTNPFNSTTQTWGEAVQITPDVNGTIAADNAALTDACKWDLVEIKDGNHIFKNSFGYLYVGDVVGSTKGAQAGLNSSGGIAYLEKVTNVCKDAFKMHPFNSPIFESSSYVMLWSTSSGYRMYAPRAYSATMSPYIRFYEYDSGVTYSNFVTSCETPSVGEEQSEATFTIQSASSATLTTGKAPTGSAVTFSNTYSTPTQIAADHTATITLSGYTGKVITGVSVYTKSDSDAGTGTYEVKVGNQIVYTATGTYKELFGNWSTSFELQSLPITNAYVQSGEEITIKISATANSLYCQSFTVQYGDPDYTRVISDNYGTICLDHGVDAGNLFGGTFYEGDYLLMNGTSPYKYYLTEVDHLEAGYPYVYVANPNASQLAVVYNNETNTAQSKRGLNGTLTDIATWESDGTNALTGNYMIVNNLFCQCGTWCGLYANRAYLDINAVDLPREYTEQPAQTGKRRLVLTNQDAPTPTGWNYLSEEGETKLSEPQKFIINNRLVIIRGNKTYDATGARLK